MLFTGEGKVCATGGNAGDGENGADGLEGSLQTKYNGEYKQGSGMGRSGVGGSGGVGGGGAGAGIGGIGGYGGSGGVGGEATIVSSYAYYFDFYRDGNTGSKGVAGESSMTMGTCYVIGSVFVNVKGGDSGFAGSAGAVADWITGTRGYYSVTFASCGGGGGGGGSGALTAYYYLQLGICNAHGGGGHGGNSPIDGGDSGVEKEETFGGTDSKVVRKAGGEGGAGGAAGYEGGAGTLFVSPSAAVGVEREKLPASTHPAAQYEMTFDANGGQFVMSVESLTATLGCELPDCIPAPTRNGFAFDGWESATGEEYYGAAGTKTISSYPVAGDVVLYAQWKAVGHTSTTPVPVPYSYFDENCPTLLSAHGGDYEAVALSAAMNGCDKVWECYVSGISPTNKDSRFTAIIKMGADGKPILSWKPPLNGETTDGAGVREGVRSYRVYGKQALDDAAEEWKIVHAGGEGNYRFFKVLVGMPESK